LVGVALRAVLYLGIDLHLDHSYCLILTQAGTYSIGQLYTYRFRVFLRVSGKYLANYMYFSPNLSPLLLHFLLTFQTHPDLFLGGL
jgi:hypothetical protein